jgi:Cu+-exporting ATPase
MVVAIVAWGVLAAGCKSEPQPGKPSTAPAAVMPKAEIAQKLCPVTGELINRNIFVDYDGRRIYFCCDMCPAQFKKDPEKFLKKLDEQMASGAGAKAPEAAAPAAGQAAAYTCPMHPDVKSDKPGACPKCGMALVPAEKTK